METIRSEVSFSPFTYSVSVCHVLPREGEKRQVGSHARRFPASCPITLQYSEKMVCRVAWRLLEVQNVGKGIGSQNFPFTSMSYAILGKMPELSGHNFPTQETVKIRPLHENSAHWSTSVSGPLGFMAWGWTEKGMGKFCSTHSCWVLYKLKSKSRVCGAKIMPRCPTLFFCWVWGEQESRNTGQSKGPWEVWIIVSRSTAWLLAGWGWKLQRLCWLSFANQPDGNLHISGKRDS